MISIIIPVYNNEEYLEKCIESVISQTYKAIEIILVDDGSTDRSGEICDEYTSKDLRIKAIHKQNGGPASARNLGLDNATGEWIGFVDSDDWIEPTMFEKLLSATTEAGTLVAYCGFYLHTCYGHKKEIIWEPVNNISALECLFRKISDIPAMWNTLYHCSIINGEKPIRFEEQYYRAQDFIFTVTVLVNNQDIDRAYIPEALYNYRAPDTGMNHLSERGLTTIQAHDRVIDLVSNDKKLKKYAIVYYVELLFFFIDSAIENKKTDFAIPYKKSLRNYAASYITSNIPRVNNKIKCIGYYLFPKVTRYILFRIYQLRIKKSISKRHNK